MKKYLTILFLLLAVTTFGQKTGKWSIANLKLKVLNAAKSDSVMVYFDTTGAAYIESNKALNIVAGNDTLIYANTSLLKLLGEVMLSSVETTTGKTYGLQTFVYLQLRGFDLTL